MQYAFAWCNAPDCRPVSVFDNEVCKRDDRFGCEESRKHECPQTVWYPPGENAVDDDIDRVAGGVQFELGACVGELAGQLCLVLVVPQRVDRAENGIDEQEDEDDIHELIPVVSFAT